MMMMMNVKALFPSVFQHCWLCDRKGIQPVRKLGVGLLVVTFDWSFARFLVIDPVATTTSVILCSKNIQNGDILALANPDPPGKGRYNGERM